MKLKLLIFLMIFNFSTVIAEDKINELSFYSGTFDVIDKEGDDQATLFGLEHRNEDLFRNTFLGKFAPVTGGFITDKNSLFVYTGVEAIYELGPVLKPSFSPGVYEAGDGKDLGSVLEFKSEIKIDFDVFANSKIGYSYSHISNNDWGNINPGTDNQAITFTKVLIMSLKNCLMSKTLEN